MIRVTTLGEIDVRAPDGERIASVLQQPRRLALLVYLAVADTRLVQRDTLLGLFWPEKPEDEARHALSQAIFFLRRALGPGTIRGEGAAAVGIIPGTLSCDARAFLDVLQRGERAEALQLYRGEFLPGFYAGGPYQLEHWIDAARGRLARAAADAAWHVAEAEAEVNPVSAAATARRAVELSLGDEAAVRRLIELLQRIGDHAGALEAYEQLRRRLADEYGAEPSTETTRRIETLYARTSQRDIAPSRGELAGAAAVEDGDAGGVPYAPPSTVTSTASAPTVRGGRPHAHPRRLAASAALTIVLIGAFVSLWGLSRDRSRGATATAPSLLVEDVRNYSRAYALDDLTGAVTTEVLARLGPVGSIQLWAEDGSAAGEARPPTLILRSGLLRSGDSVRVTALLLDGRSRVQIGQSTTVRPLGEATHLVDDVAEWLAAFARRGAGTWIRERRWQSHDPRGRALALVRTALDDRERADSLRLAAVPAAALAAYRMADTALAQAEAAAPAWTEPVVQRAEIALRTAWLHLLATPPEPGRVRTSLGAGLRHAERGVARGDVAAREMRAVVGYWLWRTAPPDSYAISATTLPRIEHDLRATLDRDPTRARAWTFLAGLLHARGEFGEARVAAERAWFADSFLEHNAEIVAVLFSTALETKDSAAARRWCGELRRRRSGENVGAFCELMLLATFGSGGMADVERGRSLVRSLPAEARSAEPWRTRHQLLLSVLLARAGATDGAAALLQRSAVGTDPESGALAAWTLLALGRTDSAATVLERYVAPRPDARGGMLLSERFRALRAHPRIAALLPATRAAAFDGPGPARPFVPVADVATHRSSATTRAGVLRAATHPRESAQAFRRPADVRLARQGGSR